MDGLTPATLLLIPLMASISTVFGVLMVPVSLGLALFIMLLEVLVAFIQAYIFTLLTALFIGQGVEMGHHGHGSDDHAHKEHAH